MTIDLHDAVNSYSVMPGQSCVGRRDGTMYWATQGPLNKINNDNLFLFLNEVQLTSIPMWRDAAHPSQYHTINDH